jgi:L-fuconate dehydratase
MTTITAVRALDIRFPTSGQRIGSDAMNPDPDYSAAYAVLVTDDGPEGHGLTFTIGRGTEVCVAAIRALAPLVVGLSVEDLEADLGSFARRLARDSQLRWIGPEKGAVHLATAALVNAAWDLAAKRAGKPLWRFLADLPSQALVDCVDFRYLTDVLTPDDALALLEKHEGTRTSREAVLRADGFPAYTTSAGWLGYDDDTVAALCAEAKADGWTGFKLKVGGDPDDDRRRARLVRDAIGPDARLMLDANQRWEVHEAIERTRALAPFDPYWIEEPTSPDDVVGHAAVARAVAPIRVATGEHVHNRVMFKQLFQLDAIAVCQLDACRLAGINEALAVMLLAAHYGVPVCPHSGGVGLSEYGQHLSMFDYLRVGASIDDRMLEYVDHLHEHFVDPVRIRNGRYLVPDAAGASVELRAESIRTYRFGEAA